MSELPARRNFSVQALVAFPILLIIFLPRPDIPGAHFLIYPAIGLLALFSIIVVGYAITHRLHYRFEVIAMLVLTFAYSGMHFISFLVNALSIRPTGIIESTRPFLLLLLFFMGAYFSRFSRANIRDGLVKAAYMILIGQLIIAFFQTFDIPVFDAIYSDEKTRGLSGIFRITGSLANPNTFGGVITQATMILLLFAPRTWWRYLGFFTAFCLLVVSGSRSQFLLFPAIIAFTLWARSGFQLKIFSLMKYSGLGLLLTSGALWLVFAMRDVFPYLAQLRAVFETGSLLAVNTVGTRLASWGGRLRFFSSEADFTEWLIGLGPRPELQVFDNDYLYVFTKYGGIGFLIHFLFVAILTLIFKQCSWLGLKVWGYQYILFTLVLGIQVETLGGWFYPLILFYLAGMAMYMTRPQGQTLS